MIPNGFDDQLMRRLLNPEPSSWDVITADIREVEERVHASPPCQSFHLDNFALLPHRYGKTEHVRRMLHQIEGEYRNDPNKVLIRYDFEGLKYVPFREPPKPRPLALVPTLQRITIISKDTEDFEVWGPSPLPSAIDAYRTFLKGVAHLYRGTESSVRQTRSQRAFAEPYHSTLR